MVDPVVDPVMTDLLVDPVQPDKALMVALVCKLPIVRSCLTSLGLVVVVLPLWVLMPLVLIRQQLHLMI
jgi:hypothetical protein